MGWLIAAMLFGATPAIGLAAESSAADVPNQSLVVYERADGAAPEASAHAQQQHRLASLASGAYGKPTDFTAKAKLSFATEKQLLAESAALLPTFPGAGLLTNGWRREGDALWWHGAPSEATPPLEIPLTVASSPEPFRLLDYDEIRIDEVNFDSVPACAPQLDLSVTGAARPMVLRAGTVSRVLLSVDAGAPPWTDKDLVYLVRRELGLAPDSVWRYAQDGQNAVLQRRLRLALDNVETVEISLAPGVEVRQVNLRVGTSESGRGARIMQFANPRVELLPNGRRAVQLDAAEALKRQFPREWNANDGRRVRARFYLDEIVIFVPGDARTTALSNPLRRIDLLGVASDSPVLSSDGGVKVVSLPIHVKKGGVAELGRQAIVDLRDVWRLGELDFGSASLSFRPPSGVTSCAVRLRGVQAVSLFNGDVPRFAKLVDSWSRRWGNVLADGIPRRDRVQDPGVVGEFFFSDLSTVESDNQAPEYEVHLSPHEKTPVLVTRVTTSPSFYKVVDNAGRVVPTRAAQFISSRGATLITEGEVPRTAIEDDALVLRGRSRLIDMSWPFDQRVPQGTWFYLAIPHGAGEVAAATVTFELADGRTLDRKVIPNRLRRLDVPEADVRKLRLRITPARLPYHIALKEMILFRPKEVTFAQALSVALPSVRSIAPKPILVGDSSPMLDMQPGRIAGIAVRGGDLHFSTTFDAPLDTVRGLRLDYHFPLPYLEQSVCPLELDLHWAKANMIRQICVERPTGDLFIPLAQLAGSSGNALDLGNLSSIDWLLRAPRGANAPVNETFSLTYSIEGRQWLTGVDRLRLSPLFRVAGVPVFAAPDRVREIAMNSYVPTFWLTLDEPTLARLIMSKGDVRSSGDSLVSLDEIVVQPKRPWTQGQRLNITAPRPQVAMPWWSKPIVWMGVLTILVFAWWRGRPSTTVSWQRRPTTVTVAASNAKAAAKRLWAAFGPWLGWMHLGIAVLAAVPGVWMAGRLGFTYRGAMLAIASAMTAWTAFQRWLDRRRTSRDTVRARMVLVGTGCACAIWSYGTAGVNPDAVWGVLPLAAAGYAIWPELSNRVGTAGKKCVYFSLLGWLLVMSASYGLGAHLPMMGSENYLFTVGDLAAVFAGRAVLLAVESAIRSRWPVLGQRVYGRAGTIYLAEATLVLLVLMIILLAKLQFLAEQLATIVYFCMVIGMVKEIWAYRRIRNNP